MSDFGLATEADCAQTQRMFPIKWTAPEALKDSVRIKIVNSAFVSLIFVAAHLHLFIRCLASCVDSMLKGNQSVRLLACLSCTLPYYYYFK